MTTRGDQDDLLDLVMTMDSAGFEPETLGELVDWLIRERARAERDRQKATVRLLELSTWWRTVHALYGEHGRGAALTALLGTPDREGGAS